MAMQIVLFPLDGKLCVAMMERQETLLQDEDEYYPSNDFRKCTFFS